jgi:hypothetical protein
MADNDNIKRIIIGNPTKQLAKEIAEELTEDTNKQIILTNDNTGTKNIQKKVKEKKMRVETNTWGLNEDDLSFETQLELLKTIYNLDILEKPEKPEKSENQDKPDKPDKHLQMIISHIKTKISGYKQQDILKKKLLETDFVSFTDVIILLNDCNMRCYYCNCETYLLYEIVREMKQWSLDRINNDIGHNKNNLVISCLECNLKRRRTNKDAFFFTKNLKIVKSGQIVE